MLQYSVYVRHCASGENAVVHLGRVEAIIPEEGVVNVITITDKQYSSMATYYGSSRQPETRSPSQLEMF